MSEKLKIIIEAIQKTRGDDIIVYDTSTSNPFVDNILICSADNLRQVFAIANNIKDLLRENGYHIRSMEGKRDSRWILLDVEDIIVHIFLDEERELYKLERLYSDLKKVDIENVQ